MTKRFATSALKTILIFRRLLEKKFWAKFGNTDWESLPDLGSWEKSKVLNCTAFSKVINALPYKSDKLAGLLDCSFPYDSPEYFFKDVGSCRDCDDWARIWSIYYTRRGYDVQEWVVTNTKHPFRDSHFVAIVKDDLGYRLLNYQRYNNVHSTPEEALDDLEGWNSGNYNADIRVQALYREWPGLRS